MTPLRRSIIILILIAGCLLAACSQSTTIAGEPRTWIDVPLDGLEVAPGQPVQIEGHAAHTAGVDHIEFWFDGQLQMTQDNPPTEGNLAYFVQAWTPPGPGDHTIQVIAIGADGSGSQPDSVRIHVGGQVAEATQVPTPTPTIGLPEIDITPTATATTFIVPDNPVNVTDTPTIPPPPAPVIQFGANSDTVDAGSCTTISWHVENAQAVAYDGTAVGPDGYSPTYCPCAAETHTLTVTGLNGAVETRSFTIQVNGSCAPPPPPDDPTDPPPPPADTTPPAPPAQLKPTNGQEFACVPKVMLRWQAASDPSEISEYRIQVERHSGDNNWKPVSGSPFQGITALEKELSIECGWYYRWRVLAVDGAGNVGNYSGWFMFTDWLS
ncbi:MAG: hypothetical protein JXB07_11225 [Anaerolineae bacterium]|nr:hypothetical protein [Anaerolineae bacterium]